MELKELEIENHNQKKIWIESISVSFFFHLIVLSLLFYFYGLQTDKTKINSIFLTLDTKKSEPEFNSTEKYLNSEHILQKKSSEKQNTKITDEVRTLSFTDIIADTTNLDQIYSEPTLNVSIKYPKGWTFIDQNQKNKLDGVTFWETDGLYNPPPYIHLEVVDNEMFLEKRYTYKINLEKYKAYYNDPEEMHGYLTQVVYIRTENDEDFKIKLMMKGGTEFKAFQPRFWAILKSFKFGKSLF